MGLMDASADKHPKVVLIDDDTVWAQLLTHKFTNDSITWRYFESGEQALQFFSDGGAADIVLLDISMPGMDGFEVLKRIKSDPAVSETPVIMMSNFAQENDIEWGQKLGARKFIDKVSVVPADVIEVINQFARKS